MSSLALTLIGSLKCCAEKDSEGVPRAWQQRLCDKLAMSTTEFSYKFIIVVSRIKDLVKKMAGQGVQRVSCREKDDLVKR